MTNPMSGMTARAGGARSAWARSPRRFRPALHAIAAQPASFLDSIHRQTTLTTTVPENGDQNPYAIVVAPVSAGVDPEGRRAGHQFQQRRQPAGARDHDRRLQSDDQEAHHLRLAAAQSRRLSGRRRPDDGDDHAQVGLGDRRQRAERRRHDRDQGAGLPDRARRQRQGRRASIANDDINMPWGNMATIDNGDTATIFVSNAGFGVGSPDGDPRVVNEATVLRIDLAIKSGKPPAVVESDRRRQRLRRAAEQGRRS